MGSNYKLIYHREALRFLEKQEAAVQERIAKALKGLIIRPPIGDIKPLKGINNLMRLRVGKYRIIFEVNTNEQMVIILAIDNRGDVYK